MASRPRSFRLPVAASLGALALFGTVAWGQAPPAFPGVPSSAAGIEAPLVPTAPSFRPPLPGRTVWMNTSTPPTEAALAGRPVVVLVWNARAVPSLDTLPWFARLTRYFSRTGRGGGDAVFLLVHVPESATPADTGPRAIADALNAVPAPGLHGVPVLLDDAGSYYADLGSPAFPTLFIFGRDAHLIDAVVGRVGRYESPARKIGREIKAAQAEPMPSLAPRGGERHP